MLVSIVDMVVIGLIVPCCRSSGALFRPSAIIFHCNYLVGLGASAVDNIEQMLIKCKEHGCVLIFASLRAMSHKVSASSTKDNGLMMKVSTCICK